MNIEELLADTFAEHEHLAPDERAVRTAIDARRGSSRATFSRPLAIAASVIVVAGAAVGAVALSTGGSPTPTPAQHSGSRTGHVQRGHHTGKAHRAGIAPLTMPFDLGYLPAGKVHWDARRLNDEGAPGARNVYYGGEYLGDLVTARHRYLIDVAQNAGGLGRPGFKSGAGRAVRIDGRKGIESAHAGAEAGYELYFRDAAGGTMYVNIAQENSHGANVDGNARQLTAWGRRLASGVRFPGTATVRPTFGLGYVPAGEKLVAFDVEGGSSFVPTVGAGGRTTSYSFVRTGRPRYGVGIGTNITRVSGTRQSRTVQGHATRFSDDRGYRTLYVLGAVHGKTVAISSGIETRATLYKIADGLQLPPH